MGSEAYRLGAIFLTDGRSSCPGVEFVKKFLSDSVLTDCIEDVKKVLVLLAVDLLEFNGHIIQLLKSLRVEEVW